jgi:hypothetical protein
MTQSSKFRRRGPEGVLLLPEEGGRAPWRRVGQGEIVPRRHDSKAAVEPGKQE